MKRLFGILVGVVLFSWHGTAQFQFSGQVDPQYKDGTLYLSLVEEYRKIDGLHNEQILQKTYADSTGYFHFSGNNLPESNRIYRIHVDMCSEQNQFVNHFSGHCENSREIRFIANNTDTLSFPVTFASEMFCSIDSKNPATSALLRIDSLQSDMKFAFASYASETNTQLNLDNWFKTLQDFGVDLDEPLGEVYIYALLSDRSGAFYKHYLKDLEHSTYYGGLLQRLQARYPESPYTLQMEEELEADRYILNRRDHIPWWVYGLGAVLLLSFLFNFFIIGKWMRYRKDPKQSVNLSNQESRIMELILQDKTNKEIAQELFISVSTVKTHINNLYKKMGVSSREELKNQQS